MMLNAMTLDMESRFREELRAEVLPSRISLVGNPMQIAIASDLLKRHSPKTVVADDGVRVRLMSMEAFGAMFLASFLEERDPPEWPILLYNIPEELLLRYAEKHGIPQVLEEKDDARRMLDSIALAQPQTYASLAKSALRLKERAEALRARERN